MTIAARTRTVEDERFALTPPPTTRSARHAARVRSEREECDRVARRQPDYRAWRERAFMITNGPDLVHVFDPVEDHSTLETVVADLTVRVQAARHGKNPRVRWWDRDLCVWQAGRLLATIRPAGGGVPVVTTFTEGREGSRVPRPAMSTPAVSQPQE